MATMIVADKLNQFLKQNSVDYTIIPHRQTYTAQETAAAEHISGKCFAKTVVLNAAGEMVMAVLRANQAADLEKIKNVLGKTDLKLAGEHEFQDLFYGCEVGAMPPFGNIYGLSVILDRHLAQMKTMTFSAGTHRTTIVMNVQRYLELVRPVIGDIAVSEHRP